MVSFKIVKNTNSIRLFKCIDWVIYNDNKTNVIDTIEFQLWHKDSICYIFVGGAYIGGDEKCLEISDNTINCVFGFSNEIILANYHLDIDNYYYRFISDVKLFYETDPYYQFVKNGIVFDNYY